jgi:hypothetical protein
MSERMEAISEGLYMLYWSMADMRKGAVVEAVAHSPAAGAESQLEVLGAMARMMSTAEVSRPKMDGPDRGVGRARVLAVNSAVMRSLENMVWCVALVFGTVRKSLW